MEWVLGGMAVFFFFALVGQAQQRLALERRVATLEEKHTKAIDSTVIMITELMKAALQLNQKIEAAKAEADETFYKKTDVA